MPTSRVKIVVADGSRVLRSIARELAQDESNWSELELATGQTGINILPRSPIDIGTLSVVYVESDVAVSIFVNSSATATPLLANGAMLLQNTSVTALTCTNSSGSTANLKIYVAGT